MTDRDWRIGRALEEALSEDAWWRLNEVDLAHAKIVTVTGISYSPKRRQYQVALRGPDGAETWHASAADIRTEPRHD